MTEFSPALCGRCGIAREHAGNPAACGDHYLEVGCLLAWWEMRVGQTFIIYARSADEALDQLAAAEVRSVESEHATLVGKAGALAPYATHMPGTRAQVAAQEGTTP